MSNYDEKAKDMARRHARGALKSPKRLLATVDLKRAEVEITELDRTATRPRGTSKRVPLDPAQIRRIFGQD